MLSRNTEIVILLYRFSKEILFFQKIFINIHELRYSYARTEELSHFETREYLRVYAFSFLSFSLCLIRFKVV